MGRAYVKRIVGDYGDTYTFGLTEPDGTPSDLTGATAAKLQMRREGYSTYQASGACVIVSPPTGGVVTYTVAATDFPSPGIYYCQVEATYPTKTLTWDVLAVTVVDRVGAP